LLAVCATAFAQRTGDHGAAGDSSLHSPPASKLEEGIVRLEISTVTSADFVARFAVDTLFIPFTSLCGYLSMLSYVSDDLDTFTCELPAGAPIVILPRLGIAIRSKDTIRFAPELARVADGECFIECAVLSRCLDVGMVFRIDQLQLYLSPDPRIPLVQQFRAKGRYASLSAFEGVGFDGPGQSVSRPILGNLAIDWATNTTASGERVLTSANYRIGGPLLFGSFQVAGGGTFDPSIQRFPSGSINSANWTFSLSESDLMRRIILGTNIAARERAYSLEMSNERTGPRRRLGSRVIDGYSHPDWTIELHKDGQLVQVTYPDSLGYYRIVVPFESELGVVEVHQLGPHGEKVVDTYRFHQPTTVLVPGTVGYRLRGDLRPSLPGIPTTSQLSLGVGLFEWLSVGCLTDYRSPELRQFSLDSVRPVPYANIWLGGTSSLNASYDPHRGTLGGQLVYGNDLHMRAQLTLTRYHLKSRELGSEAQIHLPFGPASASITATYNRDSAHSELELAPWLSARLLGVTFLATSSIRWSKLLAASTPPGEYDRRPSRPLHSSVEVMAPLLAGIVFGARAEYDHQERIVSIIDATAGCSIFDWLRFEAKYTVQRLDWKQGSITGTLGIDLSPGRGTIVSTYQDEAVTGVSQLGGSVILSPAGVTLTANNNVGLAGIVARGFLDENNNGIWDSGEKSLGPPITRLSTDGGGGASTEGRHLSIPAEFGYVVEIDRWCFADLGLFPRHAEYRVFTLPSTITILDVPFCSGYDVTGQCELLTADGSKRQNRGTIFNAMQVRLESIDGSAIYDGEVLSDGSILVAGVAAGEYKLLFDDTQLAARRLRLAAETKDVTIDTENQTMPPVTFQQVK
jgi:hypothetical protein